MEFMRKKLNTKFKPKISKQKLCKWPLEIKFN